MVDAVRSRLPPPVLPTASIARKVYMRNGVGVGALRRIYGKAKNNGVRPEHFSKASGSIIRSILKNLEAVRCLRASSLGCCSARSCSGAAATACASARDGGL